MTREQEALMVKVRASAYPITTDMARAAIAVALEEAANETMMQLPQGDDEFTRGYRMACEENARNIQALIPKGERE